MSEKISEISKLYHRNHGNCAISVAYGYWRNMGKSEKDALAKAFEFKDFSGGRAREGYCGALYAAQLLCPEKSKEIENYFKLGAKGCICCNDIRPYALIPCNRCVELAGEALDLFKK